MVVMMHKIKQKMQTLGLLVFCLCAVTLFVTKQKGSFMSKIPPTSLTLYYSPSCPYCVKVVDFMEGNNISLEKKDVREPSIKAELIEIGGKGQVPCLVRDGKPLYESADIINWLAENQLSEPKAPIDE